MRFINYMKWKGVVIDGTRYGLQNISKTNVVNLVDLDGNITKYEDEEFLELISSGEAEQAPGLHADELVDFESMHEDPKDMKPKTREQMDRAWLYTQEWIEGGYGRTTPRRLKPYIERIHRESKDILPAPHWKTVKRWIARAKSVGMPTAQTVKPRHDLKGVTDRNYDRLIGHVLEPVLAEYYDKQTHLPVSEVCEKVADKIKEVFKGIKCPSLRTIRRRILDARPWADTVGMHEDGVAADAKARPRVYGPKATKPMQVLEIDHSPLDMVVIDQDTGVPMRRPWITCVIDRYSRMIVGFYIGFEKPSVYTVLRAVRHAVFGKGYLKTQYPGIKMDWPCAGKPDLIVCDNGRDLHAEAFKKAMKDMGTNVMYCPKLKPWFKGRIESFFRTLSGVLHTIPGTTFSNYLKRGRYKSELETTMTLEALQYYITAWIVDVYHYSPHKGLKGNRPIVAWKDGMKGHRVDPPYSARQLQNILMQSEVRKPSRNGVRLFNMDYSSDKADWHELFGRSKKPRKMTVKYDDMDLSYVLVQDDKDPTHHVRLECQEMRDYAYKLPLTVHRLIERHARKKLEKNAQMYDEHLRRAKQDLWDFVTKLDAEYGLTHPDLIKLDEHMKDRMVAQTSNENPAPVIREDGTMERPKPVVVSDNPVPQSKPAAGTAEAPGLPQQPTLEDVEKFMNQNMR